jgi:tetratricopeptide (TPR) repeat protein
LGFAYGSLGDYCKAIEHHKQHLSIAREIGDRLGEGNALFNISLAFNEIKERAKAIDYAKSALKIYEQIESPAADNVRRQLAEWQG